MTNADPGSAALECAEGRFGTLPSQGVRGDESSEAAAVAAEADHSRPAC